jgi:two-component system NtrC family sensor kinase
MRGGRGVNQRSVQTALIRSQQGLAPLPEANSPERQSPEAEIEQLRAALCAAHAENATLAEAALAAQAEVAAVRVQLVQVAKLASLGELVAQVAHEINNPLAFSLSHLNMLRRALAKMHAALGSPPPEGYEESSRCEERLAAIGTGLERIRVVVTKLSTYSRMEHGKSQPVDVAEALGVVAAIVEHRIHGGIMLSTDVRRPARIECDPSLFYQSVMNLLVNAIDAMDGEGEIRISAGAVGGEYVVRVVDTGHGIPEELRARVFEPFFTTKPVGKGTGLGLSIAAAVVQSHGGTLALRAAAGRGTEAEIRVPLERVAPRFVP